MSVTIELSLEEEQRLNEAARQQGIDPAELARHLITESLPLRGKSEPEDPTIALFEQWDQEDALMTPDEIEEAKREFEEFKQSINAERTRAGSRIIYP